MEFFVDWRCFGWTTSYESGTRLPACATDEIFLVVLRVIREGVVKAMLQLCYRFSFG